VVCLAHGWIFNLKCDQKKSFFIKNFFGVEAFDRGYGLTGGWVRSGPEKGAGVGMGVMHPVFVIIM
jgi:hypothetical protein